MPGKNNRTPRGGCIFALTKCFRSDRQPEFTQLDIELSFTDVESIIQLIEELLSYALASVGEKIPRNFLRMSYRDAMENYGTDKPDISFDFKVVSGWMASESF